MKVSYSDMTYEHSLIAWAINGRQFQSEQIPMKPVRQRNDLQLIGAQIFFRHGARTPLSLLPSLQEVVYSKEHLENYLPAKWNVKLITKLANQTVPRENISSFGDLEGDRGHILKSSSGERVTTGQLTAVGEKQLFQLGKLVRSEFNNENKEFLPEVYDPKEIYCRSTFMNRTVRSAQAFLAGLYSSDKHDNEIQANGPFEIEVHHFPDEYMFPNPKLYPILLKCHSAEALYASLNDDHDLKKARLAFLQRIGNIGYAHGIVELYDDIASRLAHHFAVPQDILELTKDFEIMSGREFVNRATSIGFDTFIRSTAGPILYLIRENFNTLLQNHLTQTKESYKKLFVYSGHDSTLIPLAMAFEIYDMRWPQFAAYIFIKYYISKTDPNEAYVTVNVAGELQILPNCDDYYCPYSTFLKNLHNRFDIPKY